MTIRFVVATGRYELFIPKEIGEELWLLHSDGQPFTLVHHDRKVLEEISLKIQQKFRQRNGVGRKAVRKSKLQFVVSLLLLTAVVAGILSASFWWLKAILMIPGLFFAYKAVKIFLAGGAGNDGDADRLMMFEFREWLLAYTKSSTVEVQQQVPVNMLRHVAAGFHTS